MDDTRGKIAVCTYQPPTCQHLNCKPNPQPSHNKPDQSNDFACDTYWLPCRGVSTDEFSKYPKLSSHLTILLQEVTTLALQYWIDLKKKKTIQAHVLLHIQSLTSQGCPMPMRVKCSGLMIRSAFDCPLSSISSVIMVLMVLLVQWGSWCSWCCWWRRPTTSWSYFMRHSPDAKEHVLLAYHSYPSTSKC